MKAVANFIICHLKLIRFIFYDFMANNVAVENAGIFSHLRLVTFTQAWNYNSNNHKHNLNAPGNGSQYFYFCLLPFMYGW